MKLKLRFPGLLLLFGRQNNIPESFGKSPKDKRDFKYTILLLILWFIVLLTSFNKCKAESRALRVGEKIPNLTIGKLINSPIPSVNLADFKGKVLVFDFWTTWCGACIEEMPEVAKLRRECGDRLQVITVTSQSEQVVSKFLQRNELARKQYLTIAMQDTVLSQLFPHVSYPHIIWINPDGVYLGATTQFDLNQKTVDQIFITGRATFTDPKNDNLTYDENKPLFVEGNGGNAVYKYRCLLTGYTPGLPSMCGICADSLGVRIRATNVGLNTLILRSLNFSPAQYGHNRFYIEKPLDTLVISTARENLFCFELYGQGYSRKRTGQEMLDYLEHYFGFKASVQRRAARCLVLRSLGDHSQLLYFGRDSLDNISDKTTKTKFIRGGVITTFTTFLDRVPGNLPVIDQSGIAGRISMEFDSSQLSDLVSLNRQLSKYGLKLSEEERPLDMIVVTANPGNQPNY